MRDKRKKDGHLRPSEQLVLNTIKLAKKIKIRNLIKSIVPDYSERTVRHAVTKLIKKERIKRVADLKEIKSPFLVIFETKTRVVFANVQ